jgi:TonB family protein
MTLRRHDIRLMISSSLFGLLAFVAAQAAAPAAPAVRAQTDLADYFSQSWYPPEALRNREQGMVRFEVEVRPNGRVDSCRVTGSSGSRALDEATCAIMADRARFTPARDAAGERVADRFAARIEWVLPPQDPPPAEDARARANLASYLSDADYPIQALRLNQQGTVGFDLDISPEGRATQCHIVSSSGSELLDLTTCRIMLERARFEPARDEAGSAVPDRISSRISWRISL